MKNFFRDAAIVITVLAFVVVVGLLLFPSETATVVPTPEPSPAPVYGPGVPMGSLNGRETP